MTTAEMETRITELETERSKFAVTLAQLTVTVIAADMNWVTTVCNVTGKITGKPIEAETLIEFAKRRFLQELEEDMQSSKVEVPHGK